MKNRQILSFFSKMNGQAFTRKISMARRAGLVFPAARFHRKMRKGRLAKRIGKGAAIYMAAALEYVSREILDLAGEHCQRDKRKRLTPRYLMFAVRCDEELSILLQNVVFKESGVVPAIHKKLLLKKK